MIPLLKPNSRKNAYPYYKGATQEPSAMQGLQNFGTPGSGLYRGSQAEVLHFRFCKSEYYLYDFCRLPYLRVDGFRKDPKFQKKQTIEAYSPFMEYLEAHTLPFF